MEISFLEKKEQLVRIISGIGGVCAIGQTGNVNEVPKPGESDIDLFVLCDSVPSYEARKEVYESNEISKNCKLSVFEGGHWGTGDLFDVDGVEVEFMYFTVDETWSYLNSVLMGNHLSCENGFYPVGRLATLRNINVLFDDKNVLEAIKAKLATYPEELMQHMINYHSARMIDEEDLGRVLLRKDILFYHYVLEDALDHFLQVLYALNRTYFPSRKRSEQYIASFQIKPTDCYQRLRKVIRLAADEDTIEESVSEWFRLAEELMEFC